MKSIILSALIGVPLLSCGFDSHSAVNECLVYDLELREIVPNYQSYGGDSFSFLIFDDAFDLKNLAEESISHIRKNSENIEFDESLGLYKIFRSPNSWTLNAFDEIDGEYRPGKFIASCRKSFGLGDVICTYKKNYKGKGYQYALDEGNAFLADKILAALPILAEKKCN